MGDKSAIEWTEATWNPIVGCSRVSEGCRHCYAERQAYRAEAMGIPQYEGTTHKVGSEIRWTGKVALVESALALPLKWKKPRRIFVNSMSDLFHERVDGEWIDMIFCVMALAPQHTFQVLTKRPEAMLRWMRDDARGCVDGMLAERTPTGRITEWPLPNVWLGVSVEDQATADARIPLLLQTPAAVRWVSYEPALGPVDFDGGDYDGPGWLRGWHCDFKHYDMCDGSCSLGCPEPVQVQNEHRLAWIVVGGESGPGARPFDLAWARQTIAQCKAAGVPVFCKQIGARPYLMDGGYGSAFGAKLLSPATPDEAARWFPTDPLRDRKGGDPAQWPEDLRVREYPS